MNTWLVVITLLVPSAVGGEPLRIDLERTFANFPSQQVCLTWAKHRAESFRQHAQKGASLASACLPTHQRSN